VLTMADANARPTEGMTGNSTTGTLVPAKVIKVIIVEDFEIVEKAKKKRKKVAKDTDKKIKIKDSVAEGGKDDAGNKDEKKKESKGKAKEVTKVDGNDDDNDNNNDDSDANAKPKHGKTLSRKSFTIMQPLLHLINVPTFQHGRSG
jgi:hypothetical protein